MRAAYLLRRNALIGAIHETAGDVLTVGNTDAGLHLVVSLPGGVDDIDVVRRARQRGLFPTPLSTCYSLTAPRSGLLLGFGGSDEATLYRAVGNLGELIRSMH
jgi:GntR family transcriptional regulator/MocR family aminotransferase